MPRVFFLPSQVSVDVEPGETILDAARKAAITLEAPCDGTGTCGKCTVTLPGRGVEALPVDGTGKVSAEEEAAEIVLACQTRVWSDATVEIAAEWQNNSVRVLETGVSAAIEVDAFVRKAYLAATRTTAVYGGLRLLGCEAGDTRERLFGAVIDIGTTTLVATLVDLNDGKESATASALNPQTLHGQDVLSRIRLASEKDGLALLYNLFIAEADRLIGEICAQAGADRRNIYEVVYSGNTAMFHLATNRPPNWAGIPIPRHFGVGITCPSPIKEVFTLPITASFTFLPSSRVSLVPISPQGYSQRDSMSARGLPYSSISAPTERWSLPKTDFLTASLHRRRTRLRGYEHHLRHEGRGRGHRVVRDERGRRAGHRRHRWRTADWHLR